MEPSAIIEYGLRSGADFIEVRAETINSLRIHHHLSGTSDTAYGSETGVGIRVGVKGSVSFVSSNSLEDHSIKNLVDLGIKTSKDLYNPFCLPEDTCTDRRAFPEAEPAGSLSLEEKIDLLKSLQDTVKDVDERVLGADMILEEYSSEKQISSSEGTDLLLKVPRIYFNPRILAHNGSTVSYRRNLGRIGGYEFFRNIEPILEDFAKRTASQLEARKSPEGNLPVVMDCPLTGVFAHEIIGHSLEGDAIYEKTSVMSGKFQERIGPDFVTLVDDPTLQPGWGSYHYDDEGLPAKRKTLIKNGIINEVITDSEMAQNLGVCCTGGSRSQSYMYPLLIRMSDTFIESGDHSPEELFEDIAYGVYLRNIVGGHSDPARGLFNFEICESYLVEKGEITHPLRKSTVSGDIMETIMSIAEVGKDFILNAGFCYKQGQSVPAGIGGPHIKVESLRIGGAAQ